MFTKLKSRQLMIGLTTAILLAPLTAQAGPDADAQAAIIEASGKVEAAASSSDYSGNIVTQAQQELARAKVALSEGDEDRARNAASAAAAYADLAMATNTYRELQTKTGVNAAANTTGN